MVDPAQVHARSPQPEGNGGDVALGRGRGRLRPSCAERTLVGPPPSEGMSQSALGTPERHARMEAHKQGALEAMARGPAEHTVTVEVAADWDDHERLADLLNALHARPELLGQAVGAGVRQRVIGVTVTVEAKNEEAAQEIATRALLEEMWKLGLV